MHGSVDLAMSRWVPSSATAFARVAKTLPENFSVVASASNIPELQGVGFRGSGKRVRRS